MESVLVRVGRRRMSWQGRLLLAMLVLLPMAAVATAMTALLQGAVRTAQYRGAAVVILVVAVLLIDAVAAGAAWWWWFARPRRRVGVLDEDGIQLRLGLRSGAVPWAAFQRVAVTDANVVGFVDDEASWRCYPILRSVPRRRVGPRHQVAVTLGHLVDPDGAMRPLARWLGPDAVAPPPAQRDNHEGALP